MRIPILVSAPIAALLCAVPALGRLQSATLLVDLDSALVPFDGRVSVGGTALGRLWFSAETEAGGTGLFALGSSAGPPEPILSSTLAPGLDGLVLRQVVEFGNGRVALGFGVQTQGPKLLRRLALTDGSAAGTVLLDDLGAGGAGLDLLLVGDLERAGTRAYFAATAPGSGTELWSTDGTLAGTALFEEFTPGAGSSTFALEPGPIATATHLFFAVAPGPAAQAELRSIALGAPQSVALETGGDLTAYSAVALGDELLYAWDRGGASGLGAELYASDGTPAGTRLLGDLVPGSGSSSPRLLAAGGGAAYFAAFEPATGNELWSTDGTTAQLVVDLNPGGADGVSAAPGSSVALGGQVLFRGTEGFSGFEPWISDGTAGGTALLADGTPGPGSSSLSLARAIGGRIYFGLDPVGDQRQAWTTDGSTAGTAALGAELPPASSGFAAFASAVWFGARGNAPGDFEQELWSTDGTPAGTALAADIGQSVANADGQPFNFRSGPGRVWFSAQVAGEQSLYRSDGTPGGTLAVVDSGGSPDVLLSPLGALGGGLVYGRRDASLGETGFGEPWFTNGIPGQEVFLGDLLPGPQGSLSALSSLLGRTVQLGERLFFYADDGQGLDLWSTDGTSAGTLRVDAVASGIGGFPTTELRRVGDRLAFAADLNALESGLWFTDGTPAGTTRVSLPEFGPNPSFGVVEAVDELFYAVLNAPTGDKELWSSDGTAAGTQRVGAFNATTFGTLRAAGSTLVVAESNALTAVDAAGGTQPLLSLASGTLSAFEQFPTDSALRYYKVTGAVGGPETGLWVTDGTPAGTVRVSSDPDSVGLAATFGTDGHVVFAREQPGTGVEPWISDGTVAGTRLLIDSLPGAAGTGPALVSGARAADMFLFRAEDPSAGLELHALSVSAAGGLVNQPFGLGCGIVASPRLSVGGELRLGQQVTLDVEDAVPLAPVLHFVGLQPALVPLTGCTVLLAQPALLVTDQTNAAGSASLPFQLSSNPLWVGRSVYLQSVIGAAGGPLLGSLELSSGVELVFGG